MNTTKRKLFGTDGIRGIANSYPLTPEMVQKIGIAYGVYLKSKFPEKKNTIVVAGDTRLSSDMIKTAFISGVISTGVNVVDAAVVPTPAVSFFIKKGRFSGGVVVSASHNPYEYNGLKFFNGEGRKFSEIEEASLELVIFNKYELPKASSEDIGRVFDGEHLVESYEKFLETDAGRYLSGLEIGVDCANGATFKIAPEVFRALGAKVFVFNAEPNGLNINENCGATHPDSLASKVKNLKLHMGFAYDGDGDRCIAVDENGKILNGDRIMAILAAHYMDRNKTVVATVMSNIGLELFLKKLGINLVRVNVGDRFVSEKMLETGALIGGEQSGHIILRDFLETGDGLLTSIVLSSIVKSTGKPLSQLASLVKTYPQKLKNLEVKKKKPIEKMKKVRDAIEEVKKLLNGNGRVVVRYSGTEPLLRIMVEAENEKKLEEMIEIIENAVREEGITVE